MQSVRLIHSVDDSTAVWTVTLTLSDDSTREYTIPASERLDVVTDCVSLTIEKDGTLQTLDVPETCRTATICLRDTIQIFPVLPGPVDGAAFAVFVFFWAWLASKLVP